MTKSGAIGSGAPLLLLVLLLAGISQAAAAATPLPQKPVVRQQQQQQQGDAPDNGAAGWLGWLGSAAPDPRLWDVIDPGTTTATTSTGKQPTDSSDHRALQRMRDLQSAYRHAVQLVRHAADTLGSLDAAAEAQAGWQRALQAVHAGEANLRELGATLPDHHHRSLQQQQRQHDDGSGHALSAPVIQQRMRAQAAASLRGVVAELRSLLPAAPAAYASERWRAGSGAAACSSLRGAAAHDPSTSAHPAAAEDTSSSARSSVLQSIACLEHLAGRLDDDAAISSSITPSAAASAAPGRGLWGWMWGRPRPVLAASAGVAQHAGDSMQRAVHAAHDDVTQAAHAAAGGAKHAAAGGLDATGAALDAGADALHAAADAAFSGADRLEGDAARHAHQLHHQGSQGDSGNGRQPGLVWSKARSAFQAQLNHVSDTLAALRRLPGSSSVAGRLNTQHEGGTTAPATTSSASLHSLQAAHIASLHQGLQQLEVVAEEFFSLSAHMLHSRRLQDHKASVQGSLHTLRLSEAQLAELYGLQLPGGSGLGHVQGGKLLHDAADQAAARSADAANAIKDAGAATASHVHGVGRQAAQTVQDAAKAAAGAAQHKAEQVAEAASGASQALQDATHKAAHAVSAPVHAAQNKLQNGAEAGVSMVRDAARAAQHKARDTATAATGAMREAAHAAAQLPSAVLGAAETAAAAAKYARHDAVEKVHGVAQHAGDSMQRAAHAAHDGVTHAAHAAAGGAKHAAAGGLDATGAALDAGADALHAAADAAFSGADRLEGDAARHAHQHSAELATGMEGGHVLAGGEPTPAADSALPGANLMGLPHAPSSTITAPAEPSSRPSLQAGQSMPPRAHKLGQSWHAILQRLLWPWGSNRVYGVNATAIEADGHLRSRHEDATGQHPGPPGLLPGVLLQANSTLRHAAHVVANLLHSGSAPAGAALHAMQVLGHAAADAAGRPIHVVGRVVADTAGAAAHHSQGSGRLAEAAARKGAQALQGALRHEGQHARSTARELHEALRGTAHAARSGIDDALHTAERALSRATHNASDWVAGALPHVRLPAQLRPSRAASHKLAAALMGAAHARHSDSRFNDLAWRLSTPPDLHEPPQSAGQLLAVPLWGVVHTGRSLGAAALKPLRWAAAHGHAQTSPINVTGGPAAQSAASGTPAPANASPALSAPELLDAAPPTRPAALARWWPWLPRLSGLGNAHRAAGERSSSQPAADQDTLTNLRAAAAALQQARAGLAPPAGRVAAGSAAAEAREIEGRAAHLQSVLEQEQHLQRLHDEVQGLTLAQLRDARALQVQSCRLLSQATEALEAQRDASSALLRQKTGQHEDASSPGRFLHAAAGAVQHKAAQGAHKVGGLMAAAAARTHDTAAAVADAGAHTAAKAAAVPHAAVEVAAAAAGTLRGAAAEGAHAAADVARTVVGAASEVAVGSAEAARQTAVGAVQAVAGTAAAAAQATRHTVTAAVNAAAAAVETTADKAAAATDAAKRSLDHTADAAHGAVHAVQDTAQHAAHAVVGAASAAACTAANAATSAVSDAQHVAQAAGAAMMQGLGAAGGALAGTAAAGFDAAGSVLDAGADTLHQAAESAHDTADRLESVQHMLHPTPQPARLMPAA